MPFIVLIVAGCAGAVTGLSLIIVFITRNRNRFIFSRRNPPNPPPEDIEMAALSSKPPGSQTDGEIEQYGELYIPPDRQLVSVGLDIITRVLLGIGLPVSATLNHAHHIAADSAAELGSAPRLSLNLPRSPAMALSEHVCVVVTEASKQEKAAAYAARRIKDGKWIDVAREETERGRVDELQEEIYVVGKEEEVRDEKAEVLVGPLCYQFGSGKAMAELYR